MASPMQLIRNLADYPVDCPSVVTVGSFDGVHRGHRVLIDRLTSIAHNEGLQRVVVTFDPHPRVVLGRSEGLVELTDIEEKCHWLTHYGVDRVVVLSFNEQLASLAGEEFARTVLCQQLQAKVLVAGFNHRFGRDRIAATSLALPELRVERVERCEVEGLAVSSTLIRRAIADGDFALAEQLLGHPIKLTTL